MADPAVSSARAARLASAVREGEEARTALARRYGGPGERPALRSDLVIRRVIQMGEAKQVIKCPDPLEYYSFDEGGWGLIELFDGRRTRAEICAEYNARRPDDPIELTLVLDYENQLRDMHLLERSAAERSLALFAVTKEARRRAAEEKAEGFNPFFLLFHVFDPDKFLNRTVRFVRWFWSPPVVIASLFAFVWTAFVIAMHWTPIWSGTVELYAFLRKPFWDAVQFFVILSFIGLIHELSHAYVTKMYGGEVHDIGLALLYFTPAFYCNTTDSILFENKWHSLWVTTAGIYIEAWICTLATFFWVVSYPDTLLNEFAFKTMLFTGASTVFFNINPLIKIDGYYALTSLLEISELREESFRHLGTTVQHDVFRLPVEVPPATRRKKWIYWLYGLPALLWVGVIMSFIGGLFYNFFAKEFPEGAGILCAATLLWVFKKRVRLVTRTARLFYLDKKELLMARKNRPRALAALAAVLVLLLVPWGRRRVSVDSILRPEAVARIEAPAPAVVDRVLAQEGDRVAIHDGLFQLTSREIEAQERHFALKRERMERLSGAERTNARALEAYQAHAEEVSAAAGLQNEESLRARLVVRSPLNGRVLTARTVDLAGRYVTTGTLLAEIGDDRVMLADLPVSERLLSDIFVGAPVKAFLPERPIQSVTGRIVRISPAMLDAPPTAGTVDAAAPPAQADKFVAVAAFENPDGVLKAGALVRAKIYGRRASYAARSWRILRDWIRRVLW